MSDPNPVSGSPDKEPATEAELTATGKADRGATMTAPKQPAPG